MYLSTKLLFIRTVLHLPGCASSSARAYCVIDIAEDEPPTREAAKRQAQVRLDSQEVVVPHARPIHVAGGEDNHCVVAQATHSRNTYSAMRGKRISHISRTIITSMKTERFRRRSDDSNARHRGSGKGSFCLHPSHGEQTSNSDTLPQRQFQFLYVFYRPEEHDKIIQSAESSSGQ